MKELENLDTAARHSSADYVDYQETVDVVQIHAAVLREKTDPDEVAEVPLPMWLIVFCAWMLVMGGVYLGMFSGGFSGDVFDETAGLPKSAAQKAGEATEAAAAPKTLAQQGKVVFTGNCAQCHQVTGLGLPGQYPPLAGSEWATADQKRVIAILLKGVQGPITVAGKQFNGAMPTWEAVLTDKKIAAVTSYIRQEWGNKADEIKPETVAAARQEFAARKEPWTQADLEQIKGGAPATSGTAAPEKSGTATPAASGTAAPAGSGTAAPASP